MEFGVTLPGMATPRKKTRRRAQVQHIAIGRPIVNLPLAFEEVRLRGDLIELQRHSRAMTQEELARNAGVMRYQVSKAERATGTVNFKTAVQIADALDVSLDYLAGRTPNPNAHK